MKKLGAILALAAALVMLSLFCVLDDGGYRLSVRGDAMSPTLQNGQTIQVDRRKSPKRSEIVHYEYPLDPEREFVGRVIGLPGDVVAIHDGAAWISGTK